MNNKNTQYLLTTYPKLYAQYYLPMTQTCMCWGFDVDDGWFKIIDDLSRKLAGLDVQATQVKEKYGGLRFYTDGPDIDEAEPFIKEAEEFCYKTCETCGKQGKLYELGWFKTLCPQHAKKYYAVKLNSKGDIVS